MDRNRGDVVKGERIGAREGEEKVTALTGSLLSWADLANQKSRLTIGRGANRAPEVALSLLRAQSGRQLFPVALSLLYDTLKYV